MFRKLGELVLWVLPSARVGDERVRSECMNVVGEGPFVTSIAVCERHGSACGLEESQT
jgi:hypothetical protein